MGGWALCLTDIASVLLAAWVECKRPYSWQLLYFEIFSSSHHPLLLPPSLTGADLDTSYTMAQGLLDGDLSWNIGGE